MRGVLGGATVDQRNEFLMPKYLVGLSVFVGKDRTSSTDRCQGVLTPAGKQAFERARARLAKLVGWDTVSDGDTIEYLAVGLGRTRALLAGRKWVKGGKQDA